MLSSGCRIKAKHYSTNALISGGGNRSSAFFNVLLRPMPGVFGARGPHERVHPLDFCVEYLFAPGCEAIVLAAFIGSVTSGGVVTYQSVVEQTGYESIKCAGVEAHCSA